MNLLEAMEIRTSVRTFTGAALDGMQRTRLMETLAEAGPFGTCPRTALLDASRVQQVGTKGADGVSGGVRIGTYGIVKNPAAFLAAIVRGTDGMPDEGEKGRALFDLGFIVEKFVLEATRLGLGSCWLGGTFEKGSAAAAAGVRQNEILRALIAVGAPAGSRALLDRLIRGAAGSSGRLPASSIARVRSGQDPALLGEPATARIIEAVRRAPSASNKQPWRLSFAREEGGAISVDLGLEREARYEKLAGYGIQAIDGGIAARHVEIAAVELGYTFQRRFRAMDGDTPREGSQFMLGWKLERP